MKGRAGCTSPASLARVPRCERPVTQSGIRAARIGARRPAWGFGLGPAPREELAADRAVPEVIRVDVHVEPPRVPADLGDEPAADRGAVARVARVAALGSRQRDHDRSALVGPAPMDVGRDRILDVPDREAVTERPALDHGAEAAGAVAVAGALGAVLGDFVLAVQGCEEGTPRSKRGAR